MHRKNDRTNLVAIESLESRRLLSVNTSCEIRNAVTSDSLSGSGLYEADLPATRDQGDWNGDQRFDSSDFVYAYTKGVTSMGKGILDCQATFLQSDVVDQAFEAVDDGPVLEQRRQDIQLATAAVYSVVDLSFDGPNQTPMDTPSREIDFDVTFRHEDGTEHKVLGFWDGDGAGGNVGNQFKVRFTPTKPGRWELVEVHSNTAELNGQHQGDYVVAEESDLKGFWVPEINEQGHSWYRRSDGSYEYIVGNTHYTFLSETDKDGNPSGGDIVSDIVGNAEYFKKLRFSLLGDLAPHPTDKPFLNDEGIPTDSGVYAHRPNPSWFHQRADLAVQTAFEHDLIADLIISGVANSNSRRVLFDCDDPFPQDCARPWDSKTEYLEYVAARYGSFPNVWLTLVNEWNLVPPVYQAEEIVRYGTELKEDLAYPVPLSVHGRPGPWNKDLNGEWQDHVIMQRKLKTWFDSFRAIYGNQQADPEPIINDELSYQGAGDEHTEEDTIQAFVGAFIGGGYASTGYKPAQSLGQYVSGNFSAEEHSAADNLKWFREQIDQDIRFWEMDPTTIHDTVFRAPWAVGGALISDSQYMTIAFGGEGGVEANFTEGSWTIERWDVNAMTRTVVESDFTGKFTLDLRREELNVYFFNNEDHVSEVIVGDVNFDGVFDSSDFVVIFRAAKYELPKDDPNARATYEQGDWNGDGYFDSNDFVYAFRFGSYQP